MNPTIEPIETSGDLDWCARTMAANDPWLTLGRDYDACRAALANTAKERYIVRVDGARAGLLILDMSGPFPGYIQSICVASGAHRLYTRLGFEVVGSLTGYIVDGHDEVLLRKSRGSWSAFRPRI